MLETGTLSTKNVYDIFEQEQLSLYEPVRRPMLGRIPIVKQLVRFSLVGGLNTLIDLLLLNALLWLFPTTQTSTVLLYNACAYCLGAANSFFLNKYWAFSQKRHTTFKEVRRFVLTMFCGNAWSTLALWTMSVYIHPDAGNIALWANLSKAFAIASSAFLSYLSMRLWVFTHGEHLCNEEQIRQTHGDQSVQFASVQPEYTQDTTSQLTQIQSQHTQKPDVIQPITAHSLSVVLPVYNEEAVIAATIASVYTTLRTKLSDFEIIVVNDGSSDSTQALLDKLAGMIPQLRVICHEHNQGYGATLADGFAAASKELTFFMDADGQFDSADLLPFFTFIDSYDAVLGYRQDRQDTWMRKLNAWGWKTIIRVTLGVRVRDIDCAFKLVRTQFLHDHAPTTRGAMINAEMLYTLTKAGCSYREIGVHHLPRQGGQATGAHPRVIIRAFRELFSFFLKQRRKAATNATSANTSEDSAK